ncbi:hypothetical protein [Parasedimentitalea psychrophila]|uniref:Uncharacterized protein n=1 Tax=Parasedimentitalea psychrophila TaxID=2997337 RepID=A0A9Y2KYK9_9RHOB|nr:hypothetical protein [Parasedimentitalea psychrophila]WIY25063.1 hypothetical protein QPJ95_21660 [Parasedimentitalea psychrophila]
MFDFLDMSGFWVLAQNRPITAWLIAWGFWVIPTTIGIPCRYAFLTFNRWMRHRNISNQGWPTAPLMDADGDIVHPKTETPD